MGVPIAAAHCEFQITAQVLSVVFAQVNEVIFYLLYPSIIWAASHYKCQYGGDTQ